MSDTTAPAKKSPVALVGLLTMIAGIILFVAGGVTYWTVHSTLAEERITVSEDASTLAGDEVDGPFSAYVEAMMIEKHALKATGGKTYAELGREDPLRNTAMNGSFLRASLFTSVVAFGVAALVMGLGILFGLVGFAMRSLAPKA